MSKATAAPAAPDSAPPNPPPSTLPPQAPSAPPGGLDGRPQSIVNPENEPDHQIALMIANRKQKPADGAPAVPPPVAPVTDPTAAVPPPGAKPDVGDMLSAALKFRKKKEVVADAAPAAAAPAAPAVKDPEPPAPEKMTVKRRQPTQPPVNTADIAASAASAAATKTAEILAGSMRPAAPAEDLSELTSEERHDYEVLQFMAENDPKFKGVDATFLDNAKKARVYASKWETANPGKVFDADDEDHNDFYSGLKIPYTERELQRNEAIMLGRREAERIVKAKDVEHAEQLRKVEARASRADLTPRVNSILGSAVEVIAAEFGEEVVGAFKAGGSAKVAELNPEADDAIRGALNEAAPLIGAAIYLDDNPQLFDEKDPSHQALRQLVLAKEAQYWGTPDDQGRTLVTRSEFYKMPPQQRAGHWTLTTENLIAEAVGDAAAKWKGQMDADLDKAKKLAARLGYVPATNGTPAQPPVQPKPITPPPPPSAVIKPISPSASSGVKTDLKDPAPASGADGTFSRIKHALFKR